MYDDVFNSRSNVAHTVCKHWKQWQITAYIRNLNLETKIDMKQSKRVEKTCGGSLLPSFGCTWNSTKILEATWGGRRKG